MRPLTNGLDLTVKKHVEVIVMTSDGPLEDGGNCFTYWPEDVNQSMTCSGVEISLLKIDKFYGYSVREFHLAKNKMTLTVKHFQIHNWTNDKFPNFSSFVTMVTNMKNGQTFKHSPQNPMLVHCNNGVGKTAVFIAFYHLLDVMLQKEEVDVFGFLNSMRKDRINMVEEEDQCVFLFEVLACGLGARQQDTIALPREDQISRMLSLDTITNKLRCDDEYQLLKMFTPKFSSDKFQESKRKVNMKRIRSQRYCPVDEYRPVLSGPGNSYINATCFKSFQNKDIFITTQHPVKDTVEDFWQLVFDKKCDVIVMLSQIDPLGTRNIKYWQDNSQLLSNGLLVTLQTTKDEKHWTERMFTLTHSQNQPREQYVHHIQFRDWPDKLRPDQLQAVNLLIARIADLKTTERDAGPTLIQSRDGGGKSGVLATVLFEREQRLASAERLYIFSSDLHLRTMCPHLLDEPELYKLCYLICQEEFKGPQSQVDYENWSPSHH